MPLEARHAKQRGSAVTKRCCYGSNNDRVSEAARRNYGKIRALGKLSW